MTDDLRRGCFNPFWWRRRRRDPMDIGPGPYPPLPEDVLRETLADPRLRCTLPNYLYRSNQLLVDADDAERVVQLLATLFCVDAIPHPQSDEYAELLRTVRLRLLFVPEERWSVPQYVSRLRAEPVDGRTLLVSPNHVLGLASHTGWAPEGAPAPPSPPGPILGTPTSAPTGATTISVVDVGFREHSFFTGRCEFRNPDDIYTPIQSGNPARLEQYVGHAGFCIGLCLQAATSAKVIFRSVPRDKLLVKAGAMTACDDTALADTLRIHRGKLSGSQVLLMAVAGPTHDGELPATRRILDLYRRDNPDLVIVAAAGNQRSTDQYFPAAWKDVVGVAALMQNGDRAPYSNYGSWIDACTTGHNLYSTFLTWTGRLDEYLLSRSGQQDVDYTFAGSAVWRGTSFAAAVVAGVIADKITANKPGPAVVHELLFGPGVTRRDDLGLGATVPLPGNITTY